MILCKHQPTKTIEIWEPRFHDKKVLIGTHHISKKMEHYLIDFTGKRADGSVRYPGKRYIARKIIVRHKTDSNGSIPCYAVPMEKLDKFELREHCEHEI